ncbi:MAG TPA: immunoglobulin domain-containing protein, partial [Candidatus Dormibacteraeota bacterium]|nr:immunoglobulin domain-containing protein [Candidatus Dormibacteraeota bacterium]
MVPLSLKTAFIIAGLCGVYAISFALPSFDPFTNAAGLNANGTSYSTGTPLYHQTNGFGEGWVLWNGGSGTSSAEVMCVNSNLPYAGFPAGFPAPSPTNSILIPGLAQGVNAYGFNAALAMSRTISADANNQVTNKIFASFLLTVPSIGNLATSGTQPIFFGGFNNSTSGDLSTQTPPGSSFKLFVQGNSATPGASTTWALGIADNSGGSSERFDPTFRAPNTVLFVVVDYEFGINGNNDNANLWVNPDPAAFGAVTPPPIPTATITINSSSGNQLGQAAKFFLITRSGSALWGSILFGNLRIGTSWSFVTGGPEFTNQPASQFVPNGATATFNSAAIAGGSTVSYQWLFNGTNLPGATLASLTINNATAASAGPYAVRASNTLASVTSSNAVLTVGPPPAPVIITPLKSRTEMVGDNLAFAVAVSNSASFQWRFNGTTIPGATASGIALTNIQLTNTGTYTVLASNLGGVASNSAMLIVSNGLLHLSPANLVVARVGDGVQPLSSAIGNTLYLDQFTTAGGYVSTLMVPNNGVPALLVPGTGDAIYESVLTLSANQQFLNFAGYNVSYPYGGADVTAGNVTVRGIGAVNGLGYYTLVLTNIGLYSGGNHFIRSAASTDGLTNFWTTGAASSGGIKYIAPGLFPNGQGIPALGGGNPGTRVAGIFEGSVVFSDSEGNLTQTGVNSFSGLPTSANAPAQLLFPVGVSAHPNDFAISPDGDTVYIADDNSVANNGGIQRWDFDGVQWTRS